MQELDHYFKLRELYKMKCQGRTNASIAEQLGETEQFVEINTDRKGKFYNSQELSTIYILKSIGLPLKMIGKLLYRSANSIAYALVGYKATKADEARKLSLFKSVTKMAISESFTKASRELDIPMGRVKSIVDETLSPGSIFRLPKVERVGHPSVMEGLESGELSTYEDLEEHCGIGRSTLDIAFKSYPKVQDAIKAKDSRSRVFHTKARWSFAEIDEAMDLRSKGASFREIADTLGRTKAAVAIKLGGYLSR